MLNSKVEHKTSFWESRDYGEEFSDIIIDGFWR